MSLCNRLVLPFALFSLAALVGCGSSSNKATPPPTGSFSNTDLTGTYVFSITGSDGGGSFLTMAGTFTACGCSAGTISTGILDMNDPSFSSAAPGLAITSGSYDVTADGRGRAKLIVSTPFGNSLIVDFVLSTSKHGLITEYDSNGTGSGTLDAAATVTQSQLANGSFAFGFTGISGIDSTNGAGVPLGTVGGFTLDANGNITAGLEDFNNNGRSAGISDLVLSGTVDVTTVPGVATLATTAGTFTFDVYPIDATHLKFIEIDSLPILAGDVFTQTSSIPAANVFTVSGFDFDPTVGGPFTAAGLLMTDGSSQITAGSTEDFNDAGAPGNISSFSGSFSGVTGGRSVFTLNGFANGGGGLTGNYAFAAYPSTGGIELLEIDGAGITAGVAYTQTATSITSAQGYGLNLTGINPSGEEDDIAEFTNTSGSFAGLIDYNDQGTTSFDKRFSATYTVSGATSRATIASGSFNLVSYVVDNATTIFVEVDPNPNPQVGLGSFGLQTPGTKSNLSAMHLAALRSKPGAKNAWRRKEQK
jgi:hypothetical protein